MGWGGEQVVARRVANVIVRYDGSSSCLLISIRQRRQLFLVVFKQVHMKVHTCIWYIHAAHVPECSAIICTIELNETRAKFGRFRCAMVSNTERTKLNYKQT